MWRRVYIGVRLVGAFAVWLPFTCMLSLGYGVVNLSAERNYAWQELREWARNPSAPGEEQKFNLKYGLSAQALMLSGVVARLLTKNPISLAVCALVGWLIYVLLLRNYTQKKRAHATGDKDRFGLRGFLVTLLFFPIWAWYVFLASALLSIR